MQIAHLQSPYDHNPPYIPLLDEEFDDICIGGADIDQPVAAVLLHENEQDR